MDDFNAKIGADNTSPNAVMGTQGLSRMDGIGTRIANRCSLNQLVIEGGIFPHKLIHKATRRSPDHVTKNQIDHICFVEKDVKVIRGPEQIFHQTPI